MSYAVKLNVEVSNYCKYVDAASNALQITLFMKLSSILWLISFLLYKAFMVTSHIVDAIVVVFR